MDCGVTFIEVHKQNASESAPACRTATVAALSGISAVMRRQELPAVHEYYLLGCMTMCALFTVVLGVAIVIAAWTTRANWDRNVDPIASARSRHGKDLVVRYGCTSCHELPLAAPKGMVGPPLTHIGRQSYIAGTFPNHE